MLLALDSIWSPQVSGYRLEDYTDLEGMKYDDL